MNGILNLIYHQKIKVKEIMSSFLEIRRGGSFLERKPSSVRMRDRDTAGGRIDSHEKKKLKKKRIHIKKNWRKDLWD